MPFKRKLLFRENMIRWFILHIIYLIQTNSAPKHIFKGVYNSVIKYICLLLWRKYYIMITTSNSIKYYVFKWQHLL